MRTETRRAQGFEETKRPHTVICESVKKYFKDHGCKVVEFGIEHRDYDISKELSDLNPTDRFVRHLPDLFIHTPKGPSYLCEVKTRQPHNYLTGNWSIETHSRTAMVDLMIIDVLVFVVFADEADLALRGAQACWADIISIDKHFELGEAQSGSRLPGGLFSQKAPYLLPFRQFAQEQLGI